VNELLTHTATLDSLINAYIRIFNDNADITADNAKSGPEILLV